MAGNVAERLPLHNIRRAHPSTQVMGAETGLTWLVAAQDRSISEAFARERGRLRSFIRRRVPDPAEAEDILQEAFYELVEAARLAKRNRTDFYKLLSRHQLSPDEFKAR